MLDADTKHRIDTCRNILVGKVPDPKSQVEQITIALIYKFMDDMDTQAIDLGGKRSFFINGFEKYAWSKLLAPTMGGADTLKLYSEAIGKMTENTHLPELFRDIFKNAYLPYRDPETLKSFLKEINYFSYDHSEKLGDAFEYLLSVLGSQGDAGQFRTPRHIIDFIVEVLKPQKNETVLDPACGTAGFLISAYKHIARNNTDAKGRTTLNPAERKRLATNFRGYDISPDMVRLSLVNLYLHGFTEPHVYEYDTLTSEDRWNEFADVILANPPFMSPKGGIKPHKRFSVQSKRSEVLFVDYMAEHLSPTGRAGIIVPEGIIFQSQGSYVELRKMLVDNSLVAVISLPAGVFNPYSGVKTSILILDKQLAKKASTIAFFKVENDGFGLGAQRRAIEKNDLPTVQAELDAYLQALRNHEAVDVLALSTGQIVAKEKLAVNGDYNLSGDRYRDATATSSSFYPFVALGDICEIYQPKTITQHDLKEDGAYVVYGANGVIGRFDQFNHEFPEVIVTCRGATCGTVNYSTARSWITGNAMVFSPKTTSLLKDYLFRVLKHSDLSSTISGSAQPQITRQSIAPFKIPLPPMEVQKEIVAEIEGYQKIINGARAVLDNYRPHISINPDWPKVELDHLCGIEHGFAFKGEFFIEEGRMDLPVLLTPGNFMQGGGLYFTDRNTKRYSGEVPDAFRLHRGDLVVVMTDLSPMMKILGMPAIIDDDNFLHNQRIGKVVLKSKDVLKTFLRYAFLIDSVNGHIKREATGSTVRHTSPTRILGVEIPLPPIGAQQAIVAEIEAEQALVNANKELITRFEKKIQATLARVWGEAP